MLAILMAGMLGQTFDIKPGFTIRQGQPFTVAPATRTFYDARQSAQESNRPLVVFVGCKPPKTILPQPYEVYEAGNGEWKELTGESGPGVIVEIGKRNSSMLPASASWEAIRSEVTKLTVGGIREGVRQAPRPFYRETLLYGHDLGADVSEKAAGPWPEDVPFIRGLVSYQPAKLTQISFDRELSGIRGRALIQPVSRYVLPAKWHQPGGLQGVSGWRSDLYKLAGARNWRGPTSVPEVYPPVTFQRTYEDGSLFVDVLSNAESGKVFEARAREKTGGEWHSYVFFRDKRNRPAGYAGLNQSCVSCHGEAGTGAYGSGYVLGGDTVLSDPIPYLEN